MERRTAQSTRYDKIASRFSDILLAGLVPPPAAFFIGRFYCPPPSWRRGWDDVSSDKSIFRGMQILRSRPGWKGARGARRRKEGGSLWSSENDRSPQSLLPILLRVMMGRSTDPMKNGHFDAVQYIGCLAASLSRADGPDRNGSAHRGGRY